MSRLTRRTFLKSTLAAAASVTIAGTKSSGRVLGSNDTIRLGVAGLHGRGKDHVGAFLGIKGVELTYLIDPDARTWDEQVKRIQDKGRSRPRTVQDIRQALEDKNLDAVSVATPNHWHTLITVWACQHGKDVYVEKPCSHNVHEGRVAYEAAKKHNRIVQHGTQSRSSPEWARVMAVIQSGKLGKLLVARGLCYKPRGSIGFKKDSIPPKELNYNIWLGPAPEHAFNGNYVHYNWHWFWDFGNGDIGNQGVHEMDKARWAIAGATLPRSVLSLGGRFGYKDQGQTPNTQIAVFDFGPTQLIFEVRGLKTDPYYGEKIGNIYHLEEGTIAGGDGRFKFYPKGKGKDQGEPLPRFDVGVQRGPGGDDPFANFIAAVRSRKESDLNAPILEGHYSSALCHLANISYRLGEEVPFNRQTKSFGDDKAAYETLERMEEHLSHGNGLKLDGKKYRLGRKLAFSAETEKFLHDDQANRMLTRQYRQPFVVPEKV
jgi:predicted dehydrogenase